MNEFKPGDDAWYWDFPEDGCGGFDVAMVELRVNRDLSESQVVAAKYGHLSMSYKSKQDAIEAILNRIMEITLEETL